MIADPKASESKAKTIAGQLPNRLPMRDSALGATSGLCTEARCCISSPNQTQGPMTWPKRKSRKAHLDRARSNRANKADRRQYGGIAALRSLSPSTSLTHLNSLPARRPGVAYSLQYGCTCWIRPTDMAPTSTKARRPKCSVFKIFTCRWFPKRISLVLIRMPVHRPGVPPNEALRRSHHHRDNGYGDNQRERAGEDDGPPRKVRQILHCQACRLRLESIP